MHGMMARRINIGEAMKYPAIDDAALAAMNRLAATSEAKALRRARSFEGAEDYFEQAAKLYVEKAKALGLSPALWTTLCPEDLCGPWAPYSGDVAKEVLHGAFSQLMGGPNTSRALAVLMEAGASPWLARLPKNASQEQREKEPSHEDSQWQQAGRSAWINPWVLAEGALSKSQALGMGLRPHPFPAAIKSRKIILEAAVRAAGEFPSQSGWVEEVAKAYKQATAGASATSKGILGYSDRDAKDAAGIVLSLAAALKDDPCQEGQAMLVHAAGLWAAKTDKANASLDPRKVIRDLPDDKRRRLQAIATLLSTFPEDPEAGSILIAGTPWLKESPELASLSIPPSKTKGAALDGHSSLLALVLSTANAPALAELEKARANIWLAAAQSGEANAPRWAMEKWMFAERRWRSGDGGGHAGQGLARMLLLGAWLNGAADPRAACMEQAREAADYIEKNGGEMNFAGSVIASLESEELGLLVGESKGEAAPGPKRRRSL